MSHSMFGSVCVLVALWEMRCHGSWVSIQMNSRSNSVGSRLPRNKDRDGGTGGFSITSPQDDAV